MMFPKLKAFILNEGLQKFCKLRKILLNAQRELELVKQIRFEEERYRKETQKKARWWNTLVIEGI